MKEKVKWAEQIQVGDYVCDCRYRHIQVKRKRYLSKIGDWHVFFEDGTCCSLLGCCDSADDHSEEDHAEEIAELKKELEKE